MRASWSTASGPEPHEGEADRAVAVSLPLRLLRDPGVVDDAFLQGGEPPAGAMGRTDVIGEEVNVALDRHRLVRRAVEVGGHAGHQEPRVVADQHEPAPGPGEAEGFPIERAEIGQMLVGQRLGDEVVAVRGDAGVGDVADGQALVGALVTGPGQHLRGQVDAVDPQDTLGAEPGADPARAARQVQHPARRAPLDLQPLKEA